MSRDDDTISSAPGLTNEEAMRVLRAAAEVKASGAKASIYRYGSRLWVKTVFYATTTTGT